MLEMNSVFAGWVVTENNVEYRRFARRKALVAIHDTDRRFRISPPQLNFVFRRNFPKLETADKASILLRMPIARSGEKV